MFQFEVPDKALAKSLRVGQQIHADFTTMKVSVLPDGAAPCCGIVSVAGGPSVKSTDVKMPTINGVEPCCSVVANPALKGRMGRIVFAFPGDKTDTSVVVLKEGKEVLSGYGNRIWDLLPGLYEVRISGKAVSNVSVKSGHDTRVKVGVLRVTANKDTPLEVSDGGTRIFSRYGSQLVGLPIGSFDVKVGTQTQSVTISEGTITDF
jgi:hypothetical protein